MHQYDPTVEMYTNYAKLCYVAQYRQFDPMT